MPVFENLFLTLTRRCDMTCRHCYIEGSPCETDEISTEHLFFIIDQVAELNLKNLRIDGGEALLHPGIFDVIEYAHAKNLSPSISTNGMKIDEDVLKKIAGKIRKLIFSVDGATAESHNWLRGHSTSFDKVISSINLATKFSIKIDINMVITNQNIREVTDMVTLAEELGVNRLTFFSFSHMGRGKDMLKDAYVDASTQLTYIKQIEELKRQHNWVYFEPAWVPKGSKYCSDEELMCSSKENRTMFIDPKGDVYKCSFFLGSEFCLGNVKETSFKEIFNQSVTIKPGQKCNHGCPAFLSRQGRPHNSGPGPAFEPICFLAVI